MFVEPFMRGCNGEIKGRVHSVETLGALDGPGLRYVLFLQGCPLRCKYCHNVDTRSCSSGTLVSAMDQVDEILRYRSYLTGGLTISGGEPLMQPEFVRELICLCHEKANLHCAIDTSGGVSLASSRQAIEEADLLLLDIKGFSDKTAEELTGQSMENARETLAYCEKIKKPVWIRHVLVPGYTLFEGREDTPEMIYENFARMNPALVEGARWLSEFTCIQKIELLPYHRLGEFKWKNMNLPYPLGDTPEPAEESVRFAEKIFGILYQE